MNYTSWAAENLSKQTLTLRHRNVTLWRTTYVDGLPTILFVHGITGDHYGLVPLIEELSKTHNCLILELPGHGTSTEINLQQASVLQKWFTDIKALIEKEVTPIDVVCAHSFGCTAVVGQSNHYHRSTKTILLNPVPHPSGVYAEYARIIMRSARFWAIFYNVRAFVFLRSVTLSKANSWDAHKRIGWVSRYSRPTYRQVVYQARLVDIILDPHAYSYVKDKIDLIICGLDDTTAHQRDTLEMESIFGKSPVFFLRGGHLLPIETPDRVAALIRQIV